jgi:TolB-like protein
MKIIGKRVCPACGALVLESDPCPVCLLRVALNEDAFISRSATATSCFQLDFEHYRVLQHEDGTPIELGRGAMGVTYKAVDINLRSIVALKVINCEILGDQSACLRFVREARAAARVRHENVASVFHLGKQTHSYFYAMEFVEGEPVDRIIRRAGRLDPADALLVISLVAAGLEAIAKQKLVHRDIKPSNIMVSFEEARIVNAKIIDLGLAKSAIEDEASSVISSQGSFAGTPAYASPEQFAGLGADIRSDLYSLGVTLWELLSGDLPYRGSPLELSDQHQYAPLPIQRLSQIPRPITELVEILLEKDPCRRFQRPAELQQAIGKALEPQECWVATAPLGSEGIAVRAGESVRYRRRAVTGLNERVISDQCVSNQSGIRVRVTARSLGCVIGMIGLVFAWHLLPGHRSLFGAHDNGLAERSIAVLPFENIGPNKDDTCFADGVQDEILRNLVGIAELKVMSRTSVMQYRAEVDLRKVADALGVTNVLEGTVRRDGNHVRVSTALVDARNDNMIWVDCYDRDLTDVFAIQSEIAKQVAAKVNAGIAAPNHKRRKE